MTLSEVLPAVQQLSEAEKWELISLLTQNLNVAESIITLEPDKVYDFPTPYDCFGAADLLMEALQNSTTLHF